MLRCWGRGPGDNGRGAWLNGPGLIDRPAGDMGREPGRPAGDMGREPGLPAGLIGRGGPARGGP